MKTVYDQIKDSLPKEVIVPKDNIDYKILSWHEGANHMKAKYDEVLKRAGVDKDMVDKLLRTPKTITKLTGKTKQWSVRDDGCIDFAGCGVLSQALSTQTTIKVKEK